MSNTPKFTHGPWKFEEADKGDGRPYIIGDRYVCLIERWSQGGDQELEVNKSLNREWRANAHLIAAAPDMYAAIEAYLKAETQAQLDNALADANTALAKARGELKNV